MRDIDRQAGLGRISAAIDSRSIQYEIHKVCKPMHCMTPQTLTTQQYMMHGWQKPFISGACRGDEGGGGVVGVRPSEKIKVQSRVCSKIQEYLLVQRCYLSLIYDQS